jgi:AraC-like DNA-binding protein
VRRLASYHDCCDYFDTTMKGFSLRPAGRVDDIELFHRCIKMGRSQVDFVQFRCGREFFVHQPDDFDYYYLKLILSGRCEISVNGITQIAEAGQSLAVNPFGPLLVRWNGQCEQVMIRLDRNTLDQILGEELEMDISEPIRFHPEVLVDARPIADLVDMLRRDADSSRAFGNWRLGRQFERLFHLAALATFPTNYSEMLQHANSMVAPYYVRKAEDHIRANARDDVTIEMLAKITGVSTRSLFYGFRRWRNTTPMAFLKKTRLDYARQALLSARRTGLSVTDVATSVGYWHLSRFSSEYKARFGEPPSATLRRG